MLNSPQVPMRRPFRFIVAVMLPAAPVSAQDCADRGSDHSTRIAQYEQALGAAQNPNDLAFALAMKGEAHRMPGDFAGAVATLQKALDIAPDNARIWVELGNVRCDQRDLAGALAHYSAALAVEDHANAWTNRAETCWRFRMGQHCSNDAGNA